MRILVPLLPGLGDALTASPILRAAIESGAELDILTMLEPVAEYARALEGVRDVIQIPSLDRKIRDVLCAFSLKHRGYDLLVLPFPAPRWQYAAIASAIRATRTVLHDYGGASRLLAARAGATLVPLRGEPGVEENQRLALAAGLAASAEVENTISSIREAAMSGAHTGAINLH